MSGHSKWNNIKRKKEKTDGARAKVFTKIGREIAVAVKEGGGNPASNSKLAALIAKAKANSVPNDNIQRIIKRAEGGDKTEYEAITYEGYGPGGIAVMVETLTDNRNRTAANMRHYFDKFGGNLGQMGCVGFMFTQKGVIVVDLEDKDPDELMMDALDAGADDFDAGEDAAEVTTSPENFTAVCDALEKKGYKFISADVAQVPSTTTVLTDPDQLVQMGKLLDALEGPGMPGPQRRNDPRFLGCRKVQGRTCPAPTSMFLIEKERYYAKTPLPALPAAAGWRVPRRVPPLRAFAGKPQPRGRAASGHPAGRQVHGGHLFERRR